MDEKSAPPGGFQTYRFRAIERTSGNVRLGEMRGVNAYGVRLSLRLAGLDIETIEPVNTRRLLPEWWRPHVATLLRGRRRSQRADLADALSSLLGAGITLERAFSDLAESTVRSAAERSLLLALRDGVRDGRSFDALAAEHPEWFDPIDLALLAVGHRAGTLPTVLTDISRNHQRGVDTSHTLVMALSYPCLLLIAAIAVVAYIGNNTLPQLLKILHDAHVAAPPLTMAVATAGQALVGWWWLMVIVAATSIFWTLRWLRSRPATIWPHTWLRRSPLARAQQRIRVARIAAVLSQLLRNGIPMAEALDVTATASGSGPLARLLGSAADGIRRGESLSAHLATSPLLDPEFAQVLAVGEQTGELPAMCQRIAERYDRASQRAIEQVAALAEPAAIVVMAVLIGVVVMAAIMPLISLGDIL